jgi:hypothetical protein
MAGVAAAFMAAPRLEVSMVGTGAASAGASVVATQSEAFAAAMVAEDMGMAFEAVGDMAEDGDTHIAFEVVGDMDSASD